MRRAILTSIPQGGAPFTVGWPAVSGTASQTNVTSILLNLDNPAPRAGTITSISAYSTTAAGTWQFLTGTLSGTTLTVAAITAPISITSGVNTLPVSLAIPSGGFIGLWGNGTDSTIARYTSGAGTFYRYTSVSTAPAPGSVYTAPGSVTGQLSLQGSGS